MQGEPHCRPNKILCDSDPIAYFGNPTKGKPHGKKYITLREYKSLAEGTPLHDYIVKIYGNILLDKFPNENRVMIFESEFWNTLKSMKEATPEERHARLNRFNYDVDIFDKDLLIFVACVANHWILYLVIQPGLVDMAMGSEERMEKGGPLIVVLDSLSSLRYDHESELLNLRNYLMCQWNEKKPQRPKYTFSQNEIKFIQPKVPQQPMNSQDCGIYMLHFMELIMNRYLVMYILCLWLYLNILCSRRNTFCYSSKWPSLRNWFSASDILWKRACIAFVIRTLGQDQEKCYQLIWPALKF